MKVLVTGGTGYIGSHTVVELQSQGFEVVIADNLSNSSEEVVDRIQNITGIRPVFVRTDLANNQQAEELFRAHPNLDAVIHFAALKAVGESLQKPLLYYHNNLGSLISVLKGMQKHGIRNIIFSSSCTVYGNPEQLPVKEDAPVKPAVSVYGSTKQISEQIITDLCSTQAIESILLRYFNPIGAHESALIGELPMGVPNNLMPYITQTAIGKREFLPVYGNDYPTPDGTAIRDYIHVVDLARAHIHAMKRLLDGNNNKKVEVFNIGTGEGHSVMEVIHSFEKMTGVKLNYRIMRRREGDVEKVWADTSLANRELDWKAMRSIDEMTLSAWKWEKTLK